MSGIPEHQLFAGYGIDAAHWPRPCACGEMIAPQPHESIRSALQRHNRSDRHVRWQATGRDA